MRTEVNIEPSILRWVAENTKANKIPPAIFEYIEQWVAGTKTPTFNQVEKVSTATGIPIGYFFLKQPPKEDLSILEYRTVDSINNENPSRNLIETIHDMGRIQDWMREYMISENALKLFFVGAQNNAADITNSIRDILKIDKNWFETMESAESSFNYIRSLISDCGVIVMMNGVVGNNTHRPLDIEEFRAFTLVDQYAPLIFINSKDSTNGRLFSLLHEFAHVLLGTNNFFNDRYSTEVQVGKNEIICNAVAAEILAPDILFIEKWSSSNEEDTEAKVSRIAHYFKCSDTVIARKALEHRFIKYEEYKILAQKAIEIYNITKKRNESGGNFYNTMGSRIDHRFFNALANSISEGKTLYSDAFRLTNTNRSTFSTLAGIFRGEQ